MSLTTTQGVSVAILGGDYSSLSMGGSGSTAKDLEYRNGRAHSFPVCKVTPVGFEPTPLRNGDLSHRLSPLGQSIHECCLSQRQRQSMTFTRWVVSAAVENTCGDRARARARRHCEARPGTTRPNQPKDMQVVSISARGGGVLCVCGDYSGTKGEPAHICTPLSVST